MHKVVKCLFVQDHGLGQSLMIIYTQLYHKINTETNWAVIKEELNHVLLVVIVNKRINL